MYVSKGDVLSSDGLSFTFSGLADAFIQTDLRVQGAISDID